MKSFTTLKFVIKFACDVKKRKICTQHLFLNGSLKKNICWNLVNVTGSVL